MNPDGPLIQQKADMIRFMCGNKKPMVIVDDCMESHLVALIAIMADPEAIIVVPDKLSTSNTFFNLYNVSTISSTSDIPEGEEYIEFGCAIKDEDKGSLAYHPLDNMTAEEVERWYLNLEHSNVLPY